MWILSQNTFPETCDTVDQLFGYQGYMKNYLIDVTKYPIRSMSRESAGLQLKSKTVH